ncbi:MAG TPA: immunoglobulin domain-containing protein [Opitutaceae bacterium]|nr:immunoglobulin domain-containing protein [Opitutaceae bacterium]
MLLRPALVFLTFLASLVHAQTAWTVGRTNLPGVAFVHSVAFGNGRFVVGLSGTASGDPAVATSTDGVTWTPGTTGNPPSQGTIVFTAGAFYLAGGDSIWRSTDGSTWQNVYSSPQSMRGIATNGRSMLVGSANINATALYFSPDLSTWRPTAPLPNVGPGERPMMSELAYFAGRYYVTYYVQLTNGNLRGYMVSTVDGTTWTGFPALDGTSTFASGNGRLVSSLGIETGVSTDGVTVTRGTLPFGLSNGGVLAFAGGRFFFTGSLQASTTGLTWAPLATVTLTNPQMRGIAYGNGRYVAVGSGATIGGQPFDIIATLAAAAPPVITVSPRDRMVVEGASTTFTVALDNPDTGTTFQWRRNGTLIPGATAASLTLPAVSTADAGQYTCEVRNALGTATTDLAVLTVAPAAQAGRIINLSVLTAIDAAAPEFTVGFVVGGSGTSGTKALLVRAGGPSLSRFGVASPLADPRLELFSGTTRTGENDNWGGSAALSTAIAQVGAFAFTSLDSRDAAFFAPAAARGDSSVKISSATAGAAGPVIAEVYDATPAASFTATSPRLMNVSVLKPIGAGTTLSAGFVIGGITPKTVLIRAVGPGLTAFGLPGALADPRLSVFRQGVSAAIAENNDWGGTAALKAAFSSVGAFGLADASRDAAVLLTLEPGDYVAQATGTAAGTVLVEVYDVP